MAKDIKIATLLKEKYINLSLKEKTKNKVIVELVNLIAQSGKIKDRRAVANMLLKRERLGSTGIGNGVAIPHAKSPKVVDFVLGFGRHQEGIDFGALDGEKTHLFFILASPENEVGAHLKILADISHLVKDKFIVERLKAARDKKEIIRLISSATT
ncbi:MAG: PTS sugar transporter subunit IIA [Candidatus Omnitrophica bacterium]|nr:PTS sugar transporter subunit IIA [Candidatus Omnitrophota bacterium]